MLASYEQGTGVTQDPAEAAAWYRKAAEQGHAQACIIVGMTCYKGMGVPQDYVQAHMWFNLAAAMTPTQIADAQKLAREWRPGS